MDFIREVAFPLPATVIAVLLGAPTEDIEVIKILLPFMSSANRDPRQFAAADTLDVRRAPTRHVAFAYGPHFCLGAPLARLEAQLTLHCLLQRFPGLALAEAEPRWKPMILLRGLESLAVTWDASRPRDGGRR